MIIQGLGAHEREIYTESDSCQYLNPKYIREEDCRHRPAVDTTIKLPISESSTYLSTLGAQAGAPHPHWRSRGLCHPDLGSQGPSRPGGMVVRHKALRSTGNVSSTPQSSFYLSLSGGKTIHIEKKVSRQVMQIH